MSDSKAGLFPLYFYLVTWFVSERPPVRELTAQELGELDRKKVLVFLLFNHVANDYYHTCSAFIKDGN